MRQVWGRGEVRTEFWWGDLRERDHLLDLGVDGRTILKWESGCSRSETRGGWAGPD